MKENQLNTSINKIVVVEGLDKTGKSTFINVLDGAYTKKFGSNENLTKFSFPNKTTPIGKSIRDELEKDHPNTEIVGTPNFLSEMVHYWMCEIFKQDYKNASKNIKNYLFDRYFISTMAYQAFYNDSKNDLDFIKRAINENKFLMIPTDLIMLDLPNKIIIERTLKDEQNNLVDAHDTKDVNILDKRRDAYQKTVGLLTTLGVKIHWFSDVSVYDTKELADDLIGKIF